MPLGFTLLVGNKHSSLFWLNISQVSVFAKELSQPANGVLITFYAGRAQFVSSYTQKLLAYAAAELSIPESVLVTVFDNHLVDCSLYFTDSRNELLKCRQILVPESRPPVLPRRV